MRSPLLIVFASLALSACAKPAWMRLPDFSTSGVPTQVEEVARANVCHTVTDATEVTLLPNAEAMRAVAEQRGFEWVYNSPGKAVTEAPYAVIEYGQRPNSGYGVAVSRQALLDGNVLVLRGTFFEPQQGRWASNEPSSPCVAVSLPAGGFDEIRLIDQDGKLIVSSADGGR